MENWPEYFDIHSTDGLLINLQLKKTCNEHYLILFRYRITTSSSGQFNVKMSRTSFYTRRVTRWEEGEVYPALFQKLEKNTLFLEKITLIVVIYGLNFSFKIQFLRVSRRKNRRFLPAGPFFLELYMIVHQSTLILENSAALKKSWLRGCIPTENIRKPIMFLCFQIV